MVIAGLVILGFVITVAVVSIKYLVEKDRSFNERLKNMSEEEKLERLWGDSWRTVNGSLPQVCPRCGSTNVEKNSIGYPLSKWVLIATKTVEVEKLDKIHRLGGASTAFTKTETKEIKTYKCPKCGYTHTVG